jgi:hypothetical protein
MSNQVEHSLRNGRFTIGHRDATHQGFHKFFDPEGDFGSFEVFWAEHGADDVHNAPGWYWWACFPGCLPDADPCGPFETSLAAYQDANGG